ncbi:MAG: hypothetical protein KKD64_08390 [Alphaproteobacteria bacterium]|nr:hypothetical protein [Alphaproteobacteria bacterium]MBU0794773.1 hypothetical protein [Alphaproteobacteria bacterium]MBU0874326.1 hypothetical protein [Alphaproteobacteria bacterium]MBU1769658.1 hypothetical protein [Alphaproteobacteria bacterium]
MDTFLTFLGDRAQKVGAEGGGANKRRLPVHVPGRNVFIFDIWPQEIRDVSNRCCSDDPAVPPEAVNLIGENGAAGED